MPRPLALIGTLGKVKNCLNCETELVVGNAQFGYRRKFCSPNCIKSYWRKNNLAQHNAYNKNWAKNNKQYFDDYRRKFINKYANKDLIPWQMQARSNIAKGKLLENWVVDQLRRSGLDNRATRTPGSGNGHLKGDIYNDLNLNIECKNQAKPSLNSWWRQSQKDALGDLDGIVVWHPQGIPLENSVVILSWHFFERLLVKSQQPQTTNPDREFKWKVQRMVDSAKAVLKELNQ